MKWSTVGPRQLSVIHEVEHCWSSSAICYPWSGALLVLVSYLLSMKWSTVGPRQLSVIHEVEHCWSSSAICYPWSGALLVLISYLLSMKWSTVGPHQLSVNPWSGAVNATVCTKLLNSGEHIVRFIMTGKDTRTQKPATPLTSRPITPPAHADAKSPCPTCTEKQRDKHKHKHAQKSSF